MTYGQKITQLRKNANMTQTQLGEALNVSAQAISKWEHNLAEPDLSTIKKLSYIFKISIDDFLDINHSDGDEAAIACDKQNADKSIVVSEQIVSAVENVVKQNQAETIGYCVSCGTIVTEDNLGVKTPKVLCKKCCEAEIEKQKRLKAHKQKIIDGKVKDVKKKKRKSIVWGSIISAILLTLNIMALASGELDEELGFGIGVTIYMVYAAFAFVSEIVLDEGPIPEILVWFVTRPIKLPGIIFTLDLGGLAFLIVMKVAFAILGFFLGVFLFLIGVAIGCIVAPFSYPFTIARINKEIKQIKGEELCKEKE